MHNPHYSSIFYGSQQNTNAEKAPNKKCEQSNEFACQGAKITLEYNHVSKTLYFE